MHSRRRRTALAVLAMLAGVLLALGATACGGSDGDDSGSEPAATTEETTTEAPASTTPEEAVSDRPGCGELCLQAAPPAGTDDFGCEQNDSDLCEPCPGGTGCAEVLSDSSDVSGGVISLEMRCVVDHPCDGAVKLYVPGSLSNPLAASDVSIPANDSATVDVALTSRGRQVVGYEGDVSGDVWAFFEGTGTDELGDDIVGGPPVTIRGSRKSFTDCGQGVSAGKSTSCPFALNVASIYADGSLTEFDAESPTTGRSYHMACDRHEGTGNVYCSGGDDAFIAFPAP